MRYNSTYTPVMDLKTTIFATDEIRQILGQKLRQMFDDKLVKVTPPLFFKEDSELLIEIDNVTRQITFDTLEEYKIATFALSHTNWMRQLIDRLNLDYYQGLESEALLVWRDLSESPINSITKHELILQIKIPNDNEVFIVQDWTRKIYQIIYDLAKYVAKKYPQIQNIYPAEVDFITSQMMENELPNETSKNRELEFSIQKEAYVLRSAGMKTLSGKRHSQIPPYLYDLKNSQQIILKDRINYLPIKVATIALLANGDILKDQLMLYDYDNLLSTNFYSELIVQDYKVIEIKINLPRLYMALLAKGHISEVQAGVISSEANFIKEKYKIEVI